MAMLTAMFLCKGITMGDGNDSFPFSSVTLNSKYTVLIDPDTLFWTISRISKLNEAKTLFNELYSQDLKKELEQNMDFLNNSVALDMIEIHPTEKCNMNCDYCYIPRKYRQDDDILSPEKMEIIINKFLEFLDQNPSKGMKRIIFHGGEPLIAKNEIFNIADRYYKEIELGIQTNGTLLEEEDAEFIKERNIHVSLSIDGDSEATHNATRIYRNGKGSFQDVVKAIEYFRDYFWLGVIVTITKHNVHILPDIFTFLHKMDVPSSIFNPVNPSNSKAHLLMPPMGDLISTYKRLVDTILEINTSSEKRLVVDNVESIIMSVLTSNLRVLYCNMSPCGAARLVYVIASDGDIYPCSEFVGIPEFRCGNIFEDEIEEIIDSKTCKMLRSRTVKKIDECKTCLYRQICGANCPASVYFLNNTLYGKSPYCEFKKEITNYVFLKIAELGLEGVYSLVSNAFEEQLRKSEKLVYTVK